MASRLLRASYRMVKLMTEIELNEKITNLLSENPTQQKQSRRPYARENRVKKDDRLLRIIQRYYIPHAGYVDCGFDSTTLLHSGKYIKYPKHSHCQRWMKRLTSKKTRRCTDLVRKGNEYRRLFDYGRTCNPGQRRSQAQISSMKPLLRHGQLTAQQNIKGRMPCIYFGLNLFCSQVAMRPPCVAIIERAKCLKLLI